MSTLPIGNGRPRLPPNIILIASPPKEETTVRVQFIGDHPHAGEYGTITSVNGKFPVIDVLGQRMFEVRLENCIHGVDACFTTHAQSHLIGVSNSEKEQEA